MEDSANSPVDLDAVLKRPQQYYNVDGVGELGTGLTCLGYAMFAFLQMHTPAGALWHQMPTFILYVLVLVAIVHYGSKAIKERITYRRTGFVDYGPSYKRWPLLATAAVAAAAMAAALAVPGWRLSALDSLLGLAFALTYVRFARTVRWKWAILFAVVAGTLVIATLPAELLASIANQSSYPAVPPRTVGAFWLTMLLIGSLLIISGATSLWLYLRRTQALGSVAE